MPKPIQTTTPVGLRITRTTRPFTYGGEAHQLALTQLTDALNDRYGVLLSSDYEQPGRYTRWDIGLVDPPLMLTGRDHHFELTALNCRGAQLLPVLATGLATCPTLTVQQSNAKRLQGCINLSATTPCLPEEERTRRPGLLSAVRALRDLLATPDDPHLGLYGAFGYDLVFQFEDLLKRTPRPAHQQDLVLFLPDRLLVVDHQRRSCAQLDYDFAHGSGCDTRNLPRDPTFVPAAPLPQPALPSQAPQGHFETVVERALQAFACGDLFEVTPSQLLSRACTSTPAQVFRRLQQQNPAPYGFLINLGAEGHLVGASPEMFVRVDGARVETMPIAGTIPRGANALEDAEQVLRLLASSKERAELTMCTDVDRNDKARVCEPGSVRVLGRRQIELYSRLIHTVDHLEGRLRPEYDALDGLATHLWAVTVTGAPKPAALQFIEDHELSPRGYYGGAIGVVGLDGHLETGLTLRTIHLQQGIGRVRAGATLLHMSTPAEEAAECKLKASALLAAMDPPSTTSVTVPQHITTTRAKARVLLVDHRDSFVHNLADYFRQLNLDVTTLRHHGVPEALQRLNPDLVVLSPGPGRPSDFAIQGLLEQCATAGRPVLGVCLGMQALVEFAGGQLSILPTPQHGQASTLRVLGGFLFKDLPQEGLEVGRYHSLYAHQEDMPEALAVHAVSTDDGSVMACAHRNLPFAGVQFHPESILSSRQNVGLRILSNAVQALLPDASGR